MGRLYLRKTCIMASFWAWLTWVRVGLDQRAVFKAAGVEHLVQAEGGMAQQDLGVLEPLVVVGHGEVDLVRHLLDLLEQAGGIFHVARRRIGAG